MRKRTTKIKYKNQLLVGLDNRYKTSWEALIWLAFAAAITGITFFALSQEQIYMVENMTVHASVEEKKEPRIVKIITTQEWERQQAIKQAKHDHLANLRECESWGDDGAIGDAGESIGPFQWQKATLEDKIGRKVTNLEWIQMATDYDFIYDLTYKTYYEDGEWWRWYNCSIKLGYTG